MAASIRSIPQHGDLVVRQDRRDGLPVYLLCAMPGPNQYSTPSRDDAIAHAVSFARRLGVRAWLEDGNGFTAIDHHRD